MTKYFLFFLLTLILFSGCRQKEEVPKRPNILFLFADDQTFSTIGHLGNPEIITPNLDKLAKTGTSFTNVFNMGGWHGAVCVASRSMMISGKMLWRAKKMEDPWWAKDSTALSNTWGRLMQRNGYKTYMSGKWHVGAPAEQVFNQVRNVRPGMPGDYWPAFRKGKGKVLPESGTTEVKLKEIMPIGYHRPNDENDLSWSPSDTSHGGYWKGGKHWSEVLKDDALDFIKDAGNQANDPFFMYIAFNAPHDPRQSPQEYIDMYPLENISVPDNWLPEYPYKDSIGNSPGLRDEALAPYPRTPYAIKKHIQEYYAIITHLDQQIGEILDALEASNQLDNTYIFFSADHGLAVGQHGLIGKQSLFDHSVRVPLIMVGPDIPADKRISSDIYLQDIMATTLDLAGIEKPDYVDFKSFIGQVKGSQEQGNYKEIYGAYVNLQRMIRKDGFKLIVYPKINKVLLFDLTNDPMEMKDLAQDEQYRETVKELFSDLAALQKKMDDDLDLSNVKAFL